MKQEPQIKEFIKYVHSDKQDQAKSLFDAMATERLNERMTQIRKRVSASFLNGTKNG